MKWRPASEKPAKLLENYYCKVYRDIIKQGWKKTVLITLDGSWQTEDTVIEWLDESESPTTADASVLVEALEKIIALPGEWNEAKQLARKALADFLYPGMNNEVKSQYSTQSLPESQESKEGEEGNEEFDEAEFLKAWGTNQKDIIQWIKSRYRTTLR